MILSFALTQKEFLSGVKTCTRRIFKPRYAQTWLAQWDKGKYVHTAVDKDLRAGGRRIGEFRLTCRPYYERLSEMPIEDLEAEGGMCATVEQFCELLRVPPETIVFVIRFERVGS